MKRSFLFSVLYICVFVIVSDGRAQIEWCGTQETLEATFESSDTSIVGHVVFVAFEEDGPDTTLPSWADSLETDIPAFFRTMATYHGLYGGNME